MTEEELNNLVKQLGISRDQILREEAEMNLLNDLGANKLGSKVVFYGGTALRLAYGSPRFSEDIDLLAMKAVNFDELKKFAAKTVGARTNWRITDTKDKRNTMFALITIKE